MPKKSKQKTAPGVQIVLAAVDMIFDDTRVSPSETMDRLVEIRENIDTKIESLKSDMRNFYKIHGREPLRADTAQRKR